MLWLQSYCNDHGNLWPGGSLIYMLFNLIRAQGSAMCCMAASYLWFEQEHALVWALIYSCWRRSCPLWWASTDMLSKTGRWQGSGLHTLRGDFNLPCTCCVDDILLLQLKELCINERAPSRYKGLSGHLTNTVRGVVFWLWFIGGMRAACRGFCYTLAEPA